MHRSQRALCAALLCSLCFLLLLCACGAPGEGNAASTAVPPPSAEEPSAPEAPVPPTEEEIAAQILSAMTVEEKVGQLFFVRCPDAGAAEDVAAYHVGGVLLFGKDFKDKTFDEVLAMTGALQDAAKLPLLIGADEEGGTVVRASSNPNLREKKFASPQTVYAQGGLDALSADAAEKSAFLLALGVNVNFAPVCDVSTDSGDYIYDRTLGRGAEETAEAVSAIVAEMERADIGSVLKHFPGYGNNANTHTGISIDERPLDTFKSADLLPFAAGAAAGAGSVLVSHNIVTCMDADLPASLSPAVHALLRKDLAFDGVIMTDDLAMDALKEYTEDGSVAVMAVQAGNDMLVTTDYWSQIPSVIAAVEDGAITQAQLDASVMRVLLWKLHLGLIDADGFRETAP